MIPPRVVPCPPMNFVSECTTISPYSIGRSKIGVATVLSTINSGRQREHHRLGSQRSKQWFDAETFLGLARLGRIEYHALDRYAEAFFGRRLVLI